MQLRSTAPAIRDLCGVARTLRHVYAPVEAPNDAIARALEALARRETRAAPPERPARALAALV